MAGGEGHGLWLGLVHQDGHRRRLPSATAQALSPRFLSLLPLFPPAFGLPSHRKRETGVARKMAAAIFQLPLLHVHL